MESSNIKKSLCNAKRRLPYASTDTSTDDALLEEDEGCCAEQSQPDYSLSSTSDRPALTNSGVNLC